ncbi:ATP synthase F1 subunit delta [Candidatus Chlorohelix sp.]|uniref:ATP synthase F1 subunit delta n=1 Tax=Candidatus Chlorohelix sp. TaxID=3139201 RepID=UPI00306C17FE
MPSGSAGRRYAQAVFELARSTNTLDEWAADLVVIKQVFEDQTIAARLENPKITKDKKLALASSILKDQISLSAFNLATLLVERERQTFAGTIAELYQALLDDLRGIVVAEVTTAVPIDSEQEERIRQQLIKISGKQITMNKKVDPTIIGGVVARFGDMLIDGSIKNRLQALRKALA